jgi:hypothetical protein
LGLLGFDTSRSPDTISDTFGKIPLDPLSKEHDRIFTPLDTGEIVAEYEGGKCTVNGCPSSCDQYRWKEWILVPGDKDHPPRKEKEKEGEGEGAI